MIHAEISLYPMGTGTTSVSFYIAKSIESIQNMGWPQIRNNTHGHTFRVRKP